MNPITINEIAEATGGSLICGKGDAVIDKVSTDSRQVGSKTLFIPLKGENHDAHKFIPMAAEAGCRTFLTANKEATAGLTACNVIFVDDTLKAMQALAKYYLDKIDVKRLAVTGSVGKTSTRDMVYYMCSEKYRTGRSMANFNNDIGVPLTIFSLDDSMDIAVFEEGMDHAGEIHRLVDITRPDVAIITNVGISHLENLGSRENILKAKMEIADYFGPENTLVINESCDLLNKEDIHKDYKVIGVGEKNNDYTVSNVCDLGEKGIEFTLTVDDDSRKISLGVPGAHNAINAALAIAACSQVGISMDQAIAGLGNLELTGKRLALRESRGIRVIDDTYNAAPESMKSAINTLMNTEGRRHIAILGGMNELGADSEDYHREVGRFAVASGVDLLIGVEDKAKAIVEGADEKGGNSMWFGSKEELYGKLSGLLKSGDIVLIKASNALHMDEVSDKIINE
ncbi:MAG: UDP-N-acetylmuramoyl-tripeptide--D-alanyl-D-alanine ligase [Clostridiales bacterium]|nr:UDP-N-acetylmuramoyl-tripeptide--D-alanyl-D-alanine ligase [Clostridiales bacterium]